MSLIGPIANHTNHTESLQALPTDYSDDSLALWFAQNHAHDLRYVARKRLWYLWDAKRWREDDTLRVPDEVRRICRAAADAYGDPKIATAGKVAAVERLAKSDRRLAATVDQWDANRWLLNTPAGAVDLETGKLRPHLSEDYCTKTTAVSPGGECPLWKGFLEQTFGGDAELICFVQRVWSTQAPIDLAFWPKKPRPDYRGAPRELRRARPRSRLAGSRTRPAVQSPLPQDLRAHLG